ncbi:MAG: SMC-Scp complex subunit ScpB [Gammaproteobacteria bacterium]|nr:MAG: SMC-Scp complex subunit ScpB [Gammaproteobacteria bacterium]
MEIDQLKNVIEAILLAAGRPMSIDKLLTMFPEQEQPERGELRDAVEALQADYETRGIALIQVGGGYRIQVRETMQPWIAQLWEEKPARYTRALLETLALIAYRQPVTRGEIEEVRGVSVSTTIIKTLLEREWVHVVGHREVPGRPAMYGTTKKFLDYFSLKSLNELPSLSELRDLNEIGKDLELDLSDIPGIELTPANDEAGVEAEEGADAPPADEVTAAAETTDSDNVATLH